MNGVLEMAKEKNVSGDPTPLASSNEKYDAPIKLRKDFKRKLERVAEAFNMYPGELVEKHLAEFIVAEWERVTKLDLAALAQSRKRN